MIEEDGACLVKEAPRNTLVVKEENIVHEATMGKECSFLQRYGFMRRTSNLTPFFKRKGVQNLLGRKNSPLV